MSNHEINNLEGRVYESRMTLYSIVSKAQDAADSTRQKIIDYLEIAMETLIGVVLEILATYKDNERLEGHRQDVLSSMKDIFIQLEYVAESRYQGLANIHEEIGAFQADIINRLQTDLNEVTAESNRKRSEAEHVGSQAKKDWDNAVRLRNEAKAEFDTVKNILDNPNVNLGALLLQFNPIAAAGGIIAKKYVNRDTPTTLRERLDRLRDDLDDLRAIIDTQNHLMNQAEASVQRSRLDIDAASRLAAAATSTSVAAKDLTEQADRFKALLIGIKGSVTGLAREATEVEVSLTMPRDPSYTKSDFAEGILNICQGSLLAVGVQDGVENVLEELSRVWTVDGKSIMPIRLQRRFDEVQIIVTKHKQGGKQAQWDALVKELDTADLMR